MENFMLHVGAFVLSFLVGVFLVVFLFYIVCFVVEDIKELTLKKTKMGQVDCKCCEYSKRAYCGCSYPQEKIEALVRSGERYYLKNDCSLSNENPFIRLLRLGNLCEVFALCSEHGTVLYTSEKISDVILCCMVLRYAPTKDGKKQKK